MWGGAFIGAGLLTRHELALAAIPAAIWIVVESTGDPPKLVRRALLAGSPVLAALAVWCGYNFIRFGTPFYTGYAVAGNEAMGFGSPIRDGVIGLLLSPGASVFLYSPIVLLGAVALLHRRSVDLRTAVFFASYIIVFVLFYATIGNWLGGRSYGPRYLVPLMPFCCIALAAWFARLKSGQARRATVILVALSATVQLPGVVVDYARVRLAHAQRSDQRVLTTVDRQYDWSVAPLVLNAEAAIESVPANVQYLLGLAEPPAIKPGSGARNEGFSQQFAFSLDFWWLYLFYLGVLPAPLALAVGGLPLIGAALLAAALQRSLRQTDALNRNGP